MNQIRGRIQHLEQDEKLLSLPCRFCAIEQRPGAAQRTCHRRKELDDRLMRNTERPVLDTGAQDLRSDALLAAIPRIVP